MAEFIDVDPGELYLPPSRRLGRSGQAGSLLDQQASLDGKPPLQLIERKSEGVRAMSSQERQELLTAIEQLCEKYPDWRFGQLVANVASSP
jgi:hypothetical protein